MTNPLTVLLAKNAGFDAIWIELEHSTLSLTDASVLASAALLNGLTPFARVPYQCGMGFVQQVLDGGAMGIIFPHVHSAADARAAVDMCKFPPRGRRSMWIQQPVLGMRVTPLQKIVDVCDTAASSVVVMIEAADATDNIDEIAAVDGVDMLLVGCLDLSTDMGEPGAIETPAFRAALEAVSAACQRHGRLMGVAGLYNNRKFQDWAINTLKVRFMLCQQDSNLLAVGAMECAAAVATVDRTVPLN